MTSQSSRAPIVGISPAASRAIRGSAIASAVVIAICATALSYSGLHSLALRAGVEPHLAFVWPVIVDGLQLVGSLGVMYSTLSRISTRFPWFLMLLGTAISVAGNWMSAPKDLTAQVLHAAAPLILALVLEELMRVARHKVAEATAQTDLADVADQADVAPSATQADAATPAATTGRAAATAPASTSQSTKVAAAAQPVVATVQRPDPAAQGTTEPVSVPQSRPEPDPAAAPWPTRATAQHPVPSAGTPTLAPTLAPSAGPAVERSTGQTRAAQPTTAEPAVERVAPVRPVTTGETGTGTVSAPDPTPSPANPAADVTAADAPQPTLRERISDYLNEHPDAKAPDVYRALGTDPKYTRTLYKEVLAARTGA